MKDNDTEQIQNFSGQLLVAHPSLQDPNFARTVVLISAHQSDEGSLGVILNRPLNKTLGEVNAEYAYSPLSGTPLFTGGPVQENEMILTAWFWEEENQVFRLYFGIDEEKALEIKMMNPEADLRAFLGYAGWEKGQLEDELSEKAWVVSQIQGQVLEDLSGEQLWKRIISEISPELGFLADMPDDPSRN